MDEFSRKSGKGVYALVAFAVVFVLMNVAFFGFYSQSATSNSASGIISQSQVNLNIQENVVGTGNVIIPETQIVKSSSKKTSSSSNSASEDSDSVSATSGELPQTEQELVQVARKVTTSQANKVTILFGEKNPDFNGNKIVDFPDFLMFVQAYGKTNGMTGFDTKFDLVEDGTIAFTDFLEFVKNYGKEVESQSLQDVLEIFFSFLNPPLETNFAEGETLVIPNVIERIQFTPEGVSGLAKPAIQKVESLDGKVNVLGYDSVNDEIVITNNPGKTGSYQIQVVVEAYSNEGEFIKRRSVIISGTIYDMAELSVTIKNSETGASSAGTFWVYDKNWNLLDTGATETNGKVNFKLSIKESEISNYEPLIVQGGLGVSEVVQTEENGQRTRLSEGYVRTVKEVKSGNNVLVTSVPYGRYEDNPQDFLAYFIEQNNPIRNFDFTGELTGLNHGGLKKIIILKNDPFGDEFFTTEQQEHFKQRILDTNDINSLTPGGNFIKEDMIFFGDNFEGVDYKIYRKSEGGSDVVVAKTGVIVVLSDSKGRADANGDNLRGTIRLGWSAGNIDGPAISHEFGHVFIGSGHPSTLQENSVMSTGYFSRGTLLIVGAADKKQASILNNKEFVNDYGREYAQVDHYGRILGLYSGNEDYKVMLWGGSEWEYDEILNPNRNF